MSADRSDAENKFIQIAVSMTEDKRNIIALDKLGSVWEFNPASGGKWYKLSMAGSPGPKYSDEQ